MVLLKKYIVIDYAVEEKNVQSMFTKQTLHNKVSRDFATYKYSP